VRAQTLLLKNGKQSPSFSFLNSRLLNVKIAILQLKICESFAALGGADSPFEKWAAISSPWLSKWSALMVHFHSPPRYQAQKQRENHHVRLPWQKLPSSKSDKA